MHRNTWTKCYISIWAMPDSLPVHRIWHVSCVVLYLVRSAIGCWKTIKSKRKPFENRSVSSVSRIHLAYQVRMGSIEIILMISLLSAHILPGCLLLSMGYIGSNPYVCVTIITIALGFNGASVCTNLLNAQDLAPNYTAIIFSIINLVGTSCGATTPMVIAYFTRENVRKLMH